jgi:FkbM family methyltransferase
MKLPPVLVSIIRNLPPSFKPVRVGRVISALSVKLGFSEWIKVQREGVVFQLSVLCRTSAGEIWRGGNHGSEINMFSKAIEPESTFIDIGANVGLVSVPLGAKFRECKGIAVEPIERNVDALSRNLTLNSLNSTITIIPVALGDKVGTVSMLRDNNFGGSTGNAKIVMDAGTSTATHEVNVELLDNIWRESGSPAVSFIKVDVEGYEYQVLKGGAELISRCRPVVYGEFHNVLMPQNGYDFHDVLDLFNQNNYLVCQFLSDDVLVEIKDPSRSMGNAFFIPEERRHRFPIRSLT